MVDSRGYEVLSAEEVEELKKVCVALRISILPVGRGGEYRLA
jgi:hypothetical protein